jgi:phosphomannomutase
MVTISGIRGIVGESFIPEVVFKYVTAFGIIQNGKKMILGSDSRVSGPWIRNLIHGLLTALGYEIVDIGIVPTPTVQFIVKTHKADGGIVITSSHNDVMWNGLKFIESGDGLFASPLKCSQVFALSNSGNFKFPSFDKIGKITYLDNAIDEHIDSICKLKYIKPELIKTRKFKVCLDAINGAGGYAMKKLLEKFGCEVIGINLEPTGIFAHKPEPIPEHLNDLCKEVLKQKADLGIAVDPDVDRCVLIDERGNPLGEEYTLALAVQFYLSRINPNSIVCKNLSSTRAIDEICEKYNTKCVAAPVGEINVAEKMKEYQSPIGGEGNGGVMLTEIHIGRDALIAATLTLQHLAEENTTISFLKGTLPQYEIVKLKASIDGVDSESVVNHFKFLWDGKASINIEDGLHISTPDWWVHLRKSNTEPIIRVIGEAKGGKSKTEEICNKFLSDILEFSRKKNIIN